MSKETLAFEPGKYLFRENDSADSIYIIQEGTIAIRKRKGNAQIELARVYSGEVIGELAFFDRSPRNASALAVNKVKVIKVSFEDLDKLYDKIPKYIQTIIASVATRLKKANETIKRLQTSVINDDSTSGAAPSDSEELLETLDVLDGATTGSCDNKKNKD